MAGRTLYKYCSITVIGTLLIIAVQLSRWGTGGDTNLQVDKLRELVARPGGGIGRQLLSASLFQDVECRDVHNQPNSTLKCEFVEETDDCNMEGGAANYNYFVYCVIVEVWGAMIILIIWWLFCFVGLAVTADDFFCPSLVVISKTLHLSPNVAGVTFLAFGNGAPDLFSAIAAMGDEGADAEMGIGGLLGAGIFVTTIVCGTIAVITPFKAMERPFLRDNMFYLFGVFWTFYIIWRGHIYLYDCIGFICMYVVYVIVVVVSGSIYKKTKTDTDKTGVANNTMYLKTIDLSNASYTSTVTMSPTALSLDTMVGQDNVAFETDGSSSTSSLSRQNTFEEIKAEPSNLQNSSAYKAESDNIDKSEDGDSSVERDPPWKMFLYAINPINIDEWGDMAWYAKGYEIFKCPLVFMIKMTCPVVDYGEPEMHNWNRWLSCLHCLFSPTICVWLTHYADVWIDDVFPLYGITLIFGGVLAPIVFFTSSDYKKPVYHAAFGYAGFAIGIVWIFVIANEVVNILQTFGVVWNISNAILGLTLLAWGNSIGDWIADTNMARQGFARMGFAACYGGPFFNLMLGLGLPYLMQFGSLGVTELRMTMTAVQCVLLVFLMGNLIMSLILFLISGFHIKRYHGIILVVYYITYLVLAILAEFEIIMPDFAPN